MATILLACLSACLFLAVACRASGSRENLAGSRAFPAELRSRRSATETLLGLTQEQHDLSLHLHNRYRRLIKASNMDTMRYNLPLAEMAYKLTQSCIMKHWWPDTWPNQPFNKSALGQNLYAGSSTKLNVTVGVGGWYEEQKDYDYKNHKCTGGVCGHFTQLVWFNSHLLGCAHSFCPDFTLPDGSKRKDFHYYACNYGPGGNIAGVKPWEEGPACSKCDSGYFWCDRKEPRGLCVSEVNGQVYNESTSIPANITCTQGGCRNAGVLGCDCKCKCKAHSRQSKFCEQDCVTEDGCGTTYPARYCTDPTGIKNTMEKRCPKICGLCGEEQPQACEFVNSSAEAKNFSVTAFLLLLLLYYS